MNSTQNRATLQQIVWFQPSIDTRGVTIDTGELGRPRMAVDDSGVSHQTPQKPFIIHHPDLRCRKELFKTRLGNDLNGMFGLQDLLVPQEMRAGFGAAGFAFYQHPWFAVSCDHKVGFGPLFCAKVLQREISHRGVCPKLTGLEKVARTIIFKTRAWVNFPLCRGPAIEFFPYQQTDN
jgi:hypothetical protein